MWSSSSEGPGCWPRLGPCFLPTHTRSHCWRRCCEVFQEWDSGRTSPRAPSGLGGSARHPKCSNNLVVPTRFRSLPGPLVSLTLTPTGTTEPSPWGSESEPQEAWTHLLFLCALEMGAAAVSDPGAMDLAVAVQRHNGSWHLAAVTCLCVSAVCSVSVILPELWSVGSRTTKPSS